MTLALWDFYDEAYGDRVVTSWEGEKARINFIIDNIPSNGSRVLDIGCLDGSLTVNFIKNGNSVEAIAMSQGEVDKARSKGIDARKGDFLDSDIAENRYDVVVASEVIEHVFSTDRFLDKVANILKPGGRLVLTTPNIATFGRRLMLLLGRNPHLEYHEGSGQAGHIRYWTFSDMIEQLERIGFKIKKACSDEVNFNARGSWKSLLLARLFPTLGRTIMVVAEV
jgi:SAM-dependent methyltransferase